MKFLNILFAVFLISTMLSCKGKKSTEKVKQRFATEYAKLNAVLMKIDACKHFEIGAYSMSLNERKSLSLRVHECATSDIDSEANKINSQLKEQIDFYCDIKKVTFEFVNNGQSNKVNYEGCEKVQ